MQHGICRGRGGGGYTFHVLQLVGHFDLVNHLGVAEVHDLPEHRVRIEIGAVPLAVWRGRKRGSDGHEAEYKVYEHHVVENTVERGSTISY